MVKTVGRFAARYTGIVATVILWEVLARAHVLPDYLLEPSTVVSRLYAMLVSGDLTQHTLSSLYRSYVGFIAGSSLGILTGLVAGTSRVVGGFFDPLVSLTYPVPKIALLPILLVWLGIGDSSKIAVILMATFFPTFISAYYGARSVSYLHVWVARNVGASRIQIFREITLPAAAPQVFAGLRIALALSFVLLFSSEMIGSRSGLGYLIIFAEANLRFDVMYASIATIAILGFINDRALVAVRRRVLAWQPAEGKYV